MSIIFQARKQNIQAIGELTDDMRLNRQDRLHLLQIFAPVFLVLVLLLTPKDSVGCSWVSVMLGAVVERNGDICTITSLPWIIELLQNAAGDASAAGWWAVMLLMVLMFMDREFRSHPRKVLDGLSQAGVLVSTLYLMFLAVTVIDVCLNFTGLAKFISVDVLSMLKAFDVSANSAGSQLLALGLTHVPCRPSRHGDAGRAGLYKRRTADGADACRPWAGDLHGAYVHLLFRRCLGDHPACRAGCLCGILDHECRPDEDRLFSREVRHCDVHIPFVFALYPELLLIDQAVIDPGTGAFFDGYDGQTDVAWLGFDGPPCACALSGFKRDGGL